jgi:sulfide dehydrogenase cytochrome subunit
MKSKISYLVLAGTFVASTHALAGGKLVLGEAAMVSNPCAGCHGTLGASAGLSMPIIGGQPKPYIVASMENYRSGKRHSTLMQRLAKGYDQAQFEAMGAFFSDQAWVSSDEKTDPELVKKGEQLHKAKGCTGCHGTNGISPIPTTPRLAGQYSEYLFLQMTHYLDEHLAVPPAAAVMRSMLKGASENDIRALAQFYASQK